MHEDNNYDEMTLSPTNKNPMKIFWRDKKGSTSLEVIQSDA